MNHLKKFIGTQVTAYVNKDPLNNIRNILYLIKKLNLFQKNARHLRTMNKKLNDDTTSWAKFLERISENLSNEVRFKFMRNFLLYGGVLSTRKRHRLREEWNMNVPWALLMDPTSACNLKCTGCWAADYSKKDSLSYELMDRIVREGKEMTIYFYLFSGGEPLMRKKDIIRLCEKHPDCFFSAFTNGTLVDEAFAKEMARVGNLSLALSIEGFEDSTDFRRGDGTFNKVIEAMKLLKKYGILFGYSATYHRNNSDVMASEDFLDLMQENGCTYGWYFTYMPVGNDAHPELMATAEQREHMYHRLRAARKHRPMFLMDFWNDGQYCGGCIAAGRRFLHIAASGAVEPCAFVHYSSANIKDMSLKEAISQPLFLEYHKNQPFNDNLLMPCPALDNPDALKEIVNRSGAVSTLMQEPESVEEYTDKCVETAKKWKPVAERLLREQNGETKQSVPCKPGSNGKGEKVDSKIEEVNVEL